MTLAKIPKTKPEIHLSLRASLAEIQATLDPPPREKTLKSGGGGVQYFVALLPAYL